MDEVLGLDGHTEVAKHLESESEGQKTPKLDPFLLINLTCCSCKQKVITGAPAVCSTQGKALPAEVSKLSELWGKPTADV